MTESGSEEKIESSASKDFIRYFAFPKKHLSNPVILVAAGLILLFSLFPKAGTEVWTEAWTVICVFVLFSVLILRRDFPIQANENLSLLLPLVLLASYSFLQGVVTLFVLQRTLSSASIFPYSFDPTYSFWSAVKILATTSFIWILLTVGRRYAKLLIWSVAAVGNFSAFWGILTYLAGGNFQGGFRFLNTLVMISKPGFGTFANRNHFAFLMLMTIGLNVGLLRFGSLDFRRKILLTMCVLTSWSALILTGSRGGIISSFAIVVVLVFFPFRSTADHASASEKTPKTNRRSPAFGRKLTVLAAISSLLVLGVFFIGQDRIINRFEKLPRQIEKDADPTGYRRIDVYHAAAGVIGDYPLFGVGFGGFRFAVARHLDASGQTLPEQAHNDYLEFVASGGIVVVLLAGLFFIRFLSLLKKRFGSSSGSFLSAARIGAVCGLSGAAVHSMFDFGAQVWGNMLFLAAILSISVLSENDETAENADKEAIRKNEHYLPRILGLGLCGFLILATGLFGYSRYELVFDKSDLSEPLIAFDAEFYKQRSSFEKRKSKTQAIEDLQTAVSLRPNDHTLWLRLARLQSGKNMNEEAAYSYRRAIKLAPLYDEPHFAYGEFLIENGELDRGFGELKFASRRNSRRFYRAAEIAWKKSGRDGPETIRLLSPLNVDETIKLNKHFLQKKDYRSIVLLTCRTKNLPREHRDYLIEKLLYRKQIYYAYQIYRLNCPDGATRSGVLENGDFSAGDVQKGIGFGWRVGSSIGGANVILDKSADKNTALRVVFRGNVKPGLPVVSQIIPVEKNQNFRLEFSYRSSGMVTAGIPVLKVILKQRDSIETVREVGLMSEGESWQKKNLEIKTTADTEALEIRITRNPCQDSSDRVCPIFGSLWLDDFGLINLNR